MGDISYAMDSATWITGEDASLTSMNGVLLLAGHCDAFPTASYDEIMAAREYIAGERFTYADIQMVTSLQFLVRLNRLDIADYENLNDYINQVSNRPSFSI